MDYAVSGTEENTKRGIDGADEHERGDKMIVFLSFPSRNEQLEKVVTALRERGLTVLTNFDRTTLTGAQQKTDLRLARIRRSDAYVHFAPESPRTNGWSPLRQMEFGYALGCEIPVAYVGEPQNSLHRYGDVFADVDDFLGCWYSNEYLATLDEWCPEGEGSAAVA